MKLIMYLWKIEGARHNNYKLVSENNLLLLLLLLLISSYKSQISNKWKNKYIKFTNLHYNTTITKFDFEEADYSIKQTIRKEI